jgi:uncharacterized protein
VKWRRTKSDDVIDIRGASKGKAGGVGGGTGMQLPIPGGLGGLGGGLGIIAVLIFLAIQIFGGGGGAGGFSIDDVLAPAGTAPGAQNESPIPADEDPQRDLKDFSTYVFEDAQDMWAGVFRESGQSYDNAQMVLYTGRVSTGGCGGATSAVGLFYCPADQRLYFDLSFYQDMEQQLGASGDFAWAYVIAHEMGHHVQQQSGTSDQVTQAQSQNPDDANALSVRLELQADWYAGVWGATVFEEGALEEGDLEEAFGAAEAVGDDRIQGRTGSINPDSFTHGTSEQRRNWFTTGYESGDPAACDTFSPDSV